MRARRLRVDDGLRGYGDFFTFAEAVGDSDLGIIASGDLHLAGRKTGILADVDHRFAGRLCYSLARHDFAARKAAEFREHWTKEFDAEGREIWWTRYLARNARAATKGR